MAAGTPGGDLHPQDASALGADRSKELLALLPRALAGEGEREVSVVVHRVELHHLRELPAGPADATGQPERSVAIWESLAGESGEEASYPRALALESLALAREDDAGLAAALAQLRSWAPTLAGAVMAENRFRMASGLPLLPERPAEELGAVGFSSGIDGPR